MLLKTFIYAEVEKIIKPTLFTTVNKNLYAFIAFISMPTLALIGGHFFFEAFYWNNYPLFDTLASIPLFAGLITMGIGFFLKNEKRHFVISLGWIIFAIYWATQPEFLYYKEDGDIVNAIFCLVGIYFLWYIAYHEFLCHKRKEEVQSLNFLAGATFISGFFYFLIEKIPFLAVILIKIVAGQTVWLMQAMGYSVTTGSAHIGETVYVPVFFNGNHSVELILACTGLQSMMIFIGVILALKGVEHKRKLKAFMVTVPVIYVLNIVRNAGVIYGVEVLGYSFYVMHNVIGKIGSLLALIVLAYFAFEILPELYETIASLFSLPKRRGPIEKLFGIK